MELPTIPAKTIVTSVKDTSWFGLNYNMNIYRGCCHGCIYCDSRSECYRNEDFDHIRVKEHALETIRNDLRRKAKTGVIGTGSMSDPYNPYEESLCLTRHALELINAFEFGVAPITKSPLITRDIDILQDIKEHSPVLVKMTVTTPFDDLSNIIEPKVAPSSARFSALAKLTDAGIYSGILLMPVLPWITDTEESVVTLLRMAKAAGAGFVYPAFGVTLRDRQRTYFYNRLDESFPGLRDRYVHQFGDRYSCAAPGAKALQRRFAEECERLGLLYQMRDIIRRYRMGYGERQLKLF